MKQFKSILDLCADQARDFLMKDNQYHTFELPEYFNFEKVLQFIKEKVGNTKYEACLKEDLSQAARNGTSMSFLLSKDGEYAVRPMTLSNPVLYWLLVRGITTETNWRNIKECFNAFQSPQIEACSIPVVPDKKESFYKSTVILNWWNRIEQRVLELSLDYRYMFITDIANCYGSFNPQSIGWALSLKDTDRKVHSSSRLALTLSELLKDMQQGSNIGIPQGSTVYDFIAELILGYADLLISEKLKAIGIAGYRILRYRDDYRIFSNDRHQLEEISYALQEVLESLNLRMNVQKTRMSEDLVLDALKYDKRDYILNTPIKKNGEFDFNGLQKHLYFIYLFSREHKDGGQIKVLLNDFDKRLVKILYIEDTIDAELFDGEGNPSQEEVGKTSIFDKLKVYGLKKPDGSIKEDIGTMVAITSQIAYDNVSAAPLALRAISRLLTAEKDGSKKNRLMNSVVEKLSKRHNIEYLEIWLQNLTYSYDKKKGLQRYSMPLCKLAMGESCPLWNLSGFSPALVNGLPYASICNKESLDNLPPVIVTRPIKDYTEM